MQKLLFALLFFISTVSIHSQEFELFLLDDTLLSGPADPMEPIIFHFEATNLTDSTYLVDMIKFEQNIPFDWEISLCTEACFPPEVDEAVFFLDEMATDEISVYFYPGSIGEGSVKVSFVNTVDSENSFEHILYANAFLTSIEEAKIEFRILNDFRNQLIYIDGIIQGQSQMKIYDLNGKKIREYFVTEQNKTVDISNLEKGIYLIQIESQFLKFIRP